MPPAGVTRLLAVVIGGMVVLQSSPGLSPLKIAYLIVAGLAFLGSCRAIWRLQSTAMFDAARPWLAVSLLFSGLIVLSLPVALAHGTPISEWLRDAATYGLFAAAPVFALDAAASMRRDQLLAITVVVAGLGASSFAIDWIDVRRLAYLPISQLVLPTASMPTALFLVALGASVVDRRRRFAWMALGGLALGVFLLTGARSALFFLVAIPVVVLLAGRPLLSRSIGASLGVATVAAVFVVAIQAGFIGENAVVPGALDPGPTPVVSSPPITSGPIGSGPIGSSSPVGSAPPPAPTPTPRPPLDPNNTLIQRIQVFLASPERDASLRERVAQYEAAWNLFVSSPVVGVGLGHPIVWIRWDGSVNREFAADTPLVLPAKLGILGLVWVTCLAIVWLRFIRRLRRTAGVTMVGLAMAGWAAILFALAWTGFTVEDKGFSFALMLLLALGFIEIERGSTLDRDAGMAGSHSG